MPSLNRTDVAQDLERQGMTTARHDVMQRTWVSGRGWFGRGAGPIISVYLVVRPYFSSKPSPTLHGVVGVSGQLGNEPPLTSYSSGRSAPSSAGQTRWCDVCGYPFSLAHV